MIKTTHGFVDEKELERILGFEERSKEFVVWVEWWMPNHSDEKCKHCGTDPNTQRKNGSTLVRRDAHCILKEPSVAADALAASLR